MKPNDPRWVDVECVGETTGHKYFGRFRLKPYLSIGERTDAVRLAETLSRGIRDEISQRQVVTALAFLKFHITESADAPWWGNDGLDLLDEAPLTALSDKIRELQTPPKKEEKKEDGNES